MSCGASRCTEAGAFGQDVVWPRQREQRSGLLDLITPSLECSSARATAFHAFHHSNMLATCIVCIVTVWQEEEALLLHHHQKLLLDTSNWAKQVKFARKRWNSKWICEIPCRVCRVWRIQQQKKQLKRCSPPPPASAQPKPVPQKLLQPKPNAAQAIHVSTLELQTNSYTVSLTKVNLSKMRKTVTGDGEDWIFQIWMLCEEWNRWHVASAQSLHVWPLGFTIDLIENRRGMEQRPGFECCWFVVFFGCLSDACFLFKLLVLWFLIDGACAHGFKRGTGWSSCCCEDHAEGVWDQVELHPCQSSVGSALILGSEEKCKLFDSVTKPEKKFDEVLTHFWYFWRFLKPFGVLIFDSPFSLIDFFLGCQEAYQRAAKRRLLRSWDLESGGPQLHTWHHVFRQRFDEDTTCFSVDFEGKVSAPPSSHLSLVNTFRVLEQLCMLHHIFSWNQFRDLDWRCVFSSLIRKHLRFKDVFMLFFHLSW